MVEALHWTEVLLVDQALLVVEVIAEQKTAKKWWIKNATILTTTIGGTTTGLAHETRISQPRMFAPLIVAIALSASVLVM